MTPPGQSDTVEVVLTETEAAALIVMAERERPPDRMEWVQSYGTSAAAAIKDAMNGTVSAL